MSTKKEWETHCTASIRALKEYNLRSNESGVTSNKLPPVYQIEKELKDNHIKAKVTGYIFSGAHCS